MSGRAHDAIFEPVRSPTAFEETVERLGVAIQLGLLRPGAQLPPERELAGRLGISRSTLRRALLTLVQSGHLLATRGRGGGTFVAPEPPPVSASGARDLGARALEVLDERVAIEAGAMLLAAERVEGPDLDRLASLVDEMAGTSDFDDYRRADVRFHIGIAEAAHSARLVALMTEVQGRVGELIALIPHPEEVLTRSNAQHRRLVTLLRRGHAGHAVQLLRRHIEGTEHILAGFLPANE